MHRQEDDIKRRLVMMINTTGDAPKDGHRMIEIACVELRGFVQTGNNFHTFLFPGNEDGNKLMDHCQQEYANAAELKPETNAGAHTITAMQRVPTFFKADEIKINRDGVAAYLTEKIWAAPDFREIENEFMNYLRRSPDTVIVTHDIAYLKKFLSKAMQPENWQEFENKFYDTKHGMMQKTHKFRPAGLFPKTRGVWSKGLEFEQVAAHFGVSVEHRTGYSAMQDAILLADVLVKRKAVKMENIKKFPKSKFFREHPEEAAELPPVRKARKKK